MSQINPTQQQTNTSNDREPIAIVGIGCRLPGGADSPTKLWELLCAEFDAIGPIPPERFDITTLYDERPATPGRIMSRWGGFLEHIDRFDADFFGMAPREAERLDPQQRLLLEVAWEANEDAGITPEQLAGSRTGVFVGMWLNEFESRLFADPDQIDFYMTTGSGRYSASGRISYILNLFGPSITVDTACSSSLVAVHLACQSLWSGECSLAMAGGANVILQPHITIAYSQSRMMAPDGRCKFGDARANGYVRSEGAAIVVLKPLAAALADGNPIYALIRGSAVTNDGRSSGFLATPGQAGQEEMLRRAYAHAGVDPGSVQYVEAHGTGTAAGDPVELGALGAVLGINRPASQPCLVGSIKTNIGHTEGAAGVTGMIKAALALQHHRIPASLHLQEPNPTIPWQDLNLAVCTEQQPWPRADQPARAGVSSFGIAGTNAHVVLEAAPEQVSAQRTHAEAYPQLLAISAHAPAALKALAASYRTLLSDQSLSMADLCAGAATRRTHHRHRLAIVAHNRSEVISALDSFIAETAHPALSVGVANEEKARVAFVFPGQGSQWLGMARELLTNEPIFLQAISRCDAAIQAEAGWSPLAELAASESESRLAEIDIVQPLLFAVQVALATLWQAWGIQPSALVGHSMGEIAAAHVAGALSLADAVRVICRRSRLLRRVRGQGAMVVVELTLAEAQQAIAPYAAQLSVAVSNSIRSTVIAGDPQAIEALMQRLQARSVFCRLVNVDVASHSPQMDPLLDELRAALVELQPQAATLPLYSTVEVALADGSELNAGYWARNLREPVRFADVIQQLIASGITQIIEISPHPLLLPAVEQGLRHAEQVGLAVASLRRAEPERTTLLGSLATLYTAGVVPDWAKLVAQGTRLVQLPGYPWQREHFWYETTQKRDTRHAGGHRLLGHVFTPASAPDTHIWQTTLDLQDRPFLADHRVQQTVFFPATGFVECALAAATEYEPGTDYVIETLNLSEALILAESAPCDIQIVLEPAGHTMLQVQIFSRQTINGPAWQLHAQGILRKGSRPAAQEYDSLAALQARCATPASIKHHKLMASRALHYGPAFSLITQLWYGKQEALGQLAAPAANARPEAVRMSLLDAALQVAVAALPASTAGKTFLPVRLGKIWAEELPRDSQLYGHAILVAHTADTYQYDIRILDNLGQVMVELQDVQLQQAGSTAATQLSDLLYEMQWQTAELPAHGQPTGRGSWLIFAEPTNEQLLTANLHAHGEHIIIAHQSNTYQQTGDNHFMLNPADSAGYDTLLQAVCEPNTPPLRGVIFAWGLHPKLALPASEQLGMSVVALVQAIGTREWAHWPRLWLLTQAAQPAGNQAVRAAPSLLWGLGRVIANEYPRLHCTMIDCSNTANQAESQALARELWAGVAGVANDQVALRGSERYVARFVQHTTPPVDTTKIIAPTDTPYQLVAATPGILDSLQPREVARSAPAAGEIEVRVIAAGLNFLDVMKALAIAPGLAVDAAVALGGECVGVVEHVGTGVATPQVGETVVVLTSSYEQTSCLSTYVTVPSSFAVPIPAGLTASQAAGLPVAFVTAQYALHELGRLRRGESVLIHAAAGGVGLAAVQLCQLAGAEIFATAGSPAKREYLRSLGIQHVFDSRSLEFADQILEQTAGRGVDLVLNSLAGEAIPRSLALLAPRGRFLEIGKRDIYANSQIGLEPFKKNLAFYAIDLARLTVEDPAYVSGLFQEVLAKFASGELQPLPVQEFPISAAAEAFHHMAQARHTGKIILTLANQPVSVTALGMPVVRADASYLITGGLGALGLEVARWLVDQGARYLALLGRSVPSPQAQAAIAELENAGTHVLTIAADVADQTQLYAALERIRAELPPLRGVIHAAGVLADATIAQMSSEQFHTALGPKVRGAWNLHQLTTSDPLDLFVLFSSVAALFGLAGQANYAAGNAFLDGLAQQRRAAGQPALSINWGPWAEIGLAATQENRGSRLAEQGLGSIIPREGMAALEQLLNEDTTQASVVRLNPQTWVRQSGQLLPFFSALLDAAPVERAAPTSLRETLLAVEPGRRRRLLEDAVCSQIALVLRIAPERIERQRPLKVMGLDSLMALELRNRLEAITGLTLSATLAWNYPTIPILSEYLAECMAIPLTSPTAVAEPRSVVEQLEESSELEQLSDAMVEAALDDELAAIERLLKAE